MFPLKDNIPTDRFPLVTVLLILANIAVFGWQLSFPADQASSAELREAGISKRDQNMVEYGAIPYRVLHPDRHCAAAIKANAIGERGAELVCEGTPAYAQAMAQGGRPAGFNEAPALLTLLTSMFMHGGLLHIAGNMLFLWIFGNNVEDSMGRTGFLGFYLLAGLAAIAAQIGISPEAAIPTVGASGAIAGVLGAYLLLYPRARVLTAVVLLFFFTLIEIPALIMLGIWFAMQFLPAVGQLAIPEIGTGGGGVAYFAHVGGFVFGLAAIRLFATRRKHVAAGPGYPVY